MKFNIILADPPWQFKTWSEKGMDRSPDYPVLKLADIMSLDIESISNDNSFLFLWATSPLLPQAISTMIAWGFTYKTVAFTWIKTNKKSPGLFMGCGYYTRANAEYVLLGTRGNPNKIMPRIDRSVHSVVMAPVGKHSEKPEEVRDGIQSLFGYYPAIELFARKKSTDWTCIGNEITGNDIRVDIERIAKQ